MIARFYSIITASSISDDSLFAALGTSVICTTVLHKDIHRISQIKNKWIISKIQSLSIGIGSISIILLSNRLLSEQFSLQRQRQNKKSILKDMIINAYQSLNQLYSSNMIKYWIKKCSLIFMMKIFAFTSMIMAVLAWKYQCQVQKLQWLGAIIINQLLQNYQNSMEMIIHSISKRITI